MKELKKKLLPKSIPGKQNCLLLLLALFLVFLDQLLKKRFMVHTYEGSFFSLHFVKNTGISFGLFPGSATLMIIISALFLAALWYMRKEFENCRVCLVFLIAGTVGNLLDRIFLGYVVDYFDLGWFPVFNLADAMITLGVAGIVFFYIKEFVQEKRNKAGTK